MFNEEYDIIVVGAGHAGSEPPPPPQTWGPNPAHYDEPTKHCANVLQSSHGGIAKGQIIKEIDALGGYSGIVTDYSAIQFKMLNKSKGQPCGALVLSQTE